MLVAEKHLILRQQWRVLECLTKTKERTKALTEFINQRTSHDLGNPQSLGPENKRTDLIKEIVEENCAVPESRQALQEFVIKLASLIREAGGPSYLYARSTTEPRSLC
jgi:hypothetical protein